ncbi:response regulator transcription factor [Streptomyces sp. MspMP-M5]|uniref:response regulator transcription factor n=1 Tax=unclassified Streptomyces TaxID=2593676 RepID=UPI00035F8C30|nr:response regulator transcription factor [Streptomyces sp. MspMP-M5]
MPPAPPGPAPGPPHRVLVVADDPAVATAVTAELARAGHTTAYATDGFTALELAADFAPHAVVLDPALPGIDGLELRRRLRRGRGGPPVPVVPLAAEGPVGTRELVGRVTEALRGAGAGGAGRGGGATVAGRSADVLRVGEVVVDIGTGRALHAGRELALSRDEFALLAFLVRHPGRVFSREQLLKRVWGRDFGDLSAVAARMARLRAELEADPAAPRLLTEVWGSGYRFDPGGGEVEPVGVGAGMETAWGPVGGPTEGVGAGGDGGYESVGGS